MTNSTLAVYRLLRQLMVDGMSALAVRPVEVYIAGDVPLKLAYPFATLRMVNMVTSQATHQQRMEGDLEVMIVSNQLDKRSALLDMGDACAFAAQQWSEGSNGIIWFTALTARDSMPKQSGQIVDAEVIQERLVFHFIAWPTWLTQANTGTPLHAPAGSGAVYSDGTVH